MQTSTFSSRQPAPKTTRKIPIRDPKTGKQYEVDWSRDTPPTPREQEEILVQTRQSTFTPKEPQWYDNVATFGMRTIPSVAGSIIGAGTGALATSPTGPGMLAGGGAGAMVGGGIGSALGEGAAEWYEKARGLRDQISPGQIALQGGVGAIPFAGKAPGVGAGAKELAKYAFRTPISHAAQGAVLGGTSTGLSSLIDRGELPPIEDIGEGALYGGAAGALGGYAFGSRPAIKKIKGLNAAKQAAQTQVVPPVTPIRPNVAPGGGIVPPPVKPIVAPGGGIVRPQTPTLPPIETLPTTNTPDNVGYNRDEGRSEIPRPSGKKLTFDQDRVAADPRDIPAYESQGFVVKDTYPDGSVLMEKAGKNIPTPDEPTIPGQEGPFTGGRRQSTLTNALAKAVAGLPPGTQPPSAAEGAINAVNQRTKVGLAELAAKKRMIQSGELLPNQPGHPIQGANPDLLPPVEPPQGGPPTQPPGKGKKAERPGFATLKPELRGAKPKHAGGRDIDFANDLDKSLYIIAQNTASKRHAEYLQFITDTLGIDESTASNLAQRIKKAISVAAKNQKDGNVKLPSLFDKHLPDVVKKLEGEKGFILNPFARSGSGSGPAQPRKPIQLAGLGGRVMKAVRGSEAYKGMYEPIGVSVKTRLERMGKGGEILAKELGDERTESARYGGEHATKIRLAERELNPDQQKELVAMLNKSGTSTDPLVSKHYRELKGSLQTLSQEAEKAKVQVKDQATGKWDDWQRGVNEKTPDYNRGLEGVASHQYEVARDIVRAQTFGNLEDKGSYIRQAIARTNSPEEARELVDHLFNRNVKSGSKKTLEAQQKWYNRWVKAEVATKLSQFALTNMGDLAPISSNLGARNTFNAIKQVLKDKHGSADIAARSGAHSILQKELLHDVGVGKLLGKAYGSTTTEKFTRTVGALAGRAEAQRLFELAKKDPKYLKQLSRFVDGDVNAIMKQSSLTQRQIDFAGGRGVELSSGVPDKLTLPKAFHADNPLLRLPFLFKRFAFTNSKNMIDAVKAEPDFKSKVAKMTKMLAAFGFVGEAIGDVKALVRSIGSDKSAGEELEARNERYKLGVGKYKIDNPIMNRLMADWMQAALFGIIGDVSESAATKKVGKASGVALGPLGSDADELLQVGSDLSEGKLRTTGKAIARRVPYIGTGLGDRFKADTGSDKPGGLKGLPKSHFKRGTIWDQ